MDPQDIQRHLSATIEYTLDNVRVESAKLLLDQSVPLQCRDANIKLSSLINEEHYKLVDAQTWLKLINKQPIVIGREISTSNNNYDQHFYVDRSFKQTPVILEDVLKDESLLTSYAISDIDEATFQGLVKERKVLVWTNECLSSGPERTWAQYIILDSSNGAQQYEQLCQQSPHRTIHWFKKVEGGFHWLKTRSVYGQIERLQEFVNDRLISYYTEDDFTSDIEMHRVFLVSDTPGVGKSTVLTSIAHRLIKTFPHLWVIKIDLNDYSKILDEEQNNKSFEKYDLSGALKFLVDKLLGSRVESRLETEFERNLLIHFLQHNEDRVVIMFDGFDEIKESHQNVIISLFVALKSSKVKQLWVTTRPHMRKTLENTLDQLPFTLQPLDETDQVNSLVRFWRRRMSLGVQSDVASGCSSDTKLQCFAETLIKLLSESISDREKVFIGVPLQLRMIAECFEEDAENIYKSHANQPHLPLKLKLNDLFPDFFIRKCRIFQSDKNLVDFSNLNWKSQNDVLKEIFLNDHQIASLFTIFDEGELELLLTRDEIGRGLSFKSNISKHKINTGLIDLIVEGKPHFVHLTFAEYLTAEFIVNLLAKEQPSIELMKLMLTKVFFEDEFKVVRAFIDSHLAQKTLTDAVLKMHGKVLRSVYSEKIKISQLGKFISGVFQRENEICFFPHRRNICSVLHLTANEGNANLANFLLNCLRNCNIRAKLIKSVDDGQMQALHLAAEHGQLDVVRVLVEHKADLTAQIHKVNVWKLEDYDGFNALFLAAFHGHTDICEWLIGNGADINAKVCGKGQFRGYNVLDIAFLNGQSDVVKMLKNVKKLDFSTALKRGYRNNGNTALHIMARLRQWCVVKRIVIQGLVNINAIYTHDYFDKETVLMEAVQFGPPDMVEWLIEHNADVNIGTALHIAACFNEFSIAKMLVNGGANVNAVDHNGETPLHRAAINRCGEVAELLLTMKDVDVNAVNRRGQTPLHLAAYAYHTKWKVVEILLSNGARVNAVDKYGKMPLHLAAEMGCDLVVECLLKYQDVDVATKDGWTPLHIAARYNRLNVVKTLVSHNANVNAVTNNRESPLHFAAAKGSDEVVEFLLTVKDVDVNAVDRYRRTPLQVASKKGHQNTTKTLKKFVMKSGKWNPNGCIVN